MAILLIGTMDTKGNEVGFVRDLLLQAGNDVVVLDAGSMGEPTIESDITRDQVFEAAGSDLRSVQATGDRGNAVGLAARGVEVIARRLHDEGTIDGIMSLGGSAGTIIGSSAMRVLPFGVPKLMVSTLASGQVRPYVGVRDIMMHYSVTDISGINRLSRIVLANAAHAMAGMVAHSVPIAADDKPLVAATMFGVTTPCVDAARKVIEQAGYEVLVFHATGAGGQAMESLIADGMICGVLDLTTTEIADELVGGVLSAGPERLDAAARTGIPQVVSVGAVDMVNFGPRDSIPPEFSAREFYEHNSAVTLMRTTAEENRQIGTEIARKLRIATGPAVIILPLQGVSAIDCVGKPFMNKKADQALFDSIRSNVSGNIDLIEVDAHINDTSFAQRSARELLRLMRTKD